MEVAISVFFVMGLRWVSTDWLGAGPGTLPTKELLHEKLRLEIQDITKWIDESQETKRCLNVFALFLEYAAEDRESRLAKSAFPPRPDSR